MLFIASELVVPLRALPSERAEQVTQLLFGEQAEWLEQRENWALLRCCHDGYEGWAAADMLAPAPAGAQGRRLQSGAISLDQKSLLTLPPGACWPVSEPRLSLPGREIQLVQSQPTPCQPPDPWSAGLQYLHTPYLWGGRHPLGIDCSGLVQMAFLLCDISLLRDASLQASQGGPVSDFDDHQRNDLFFFSKTPGGPVTHVGMANGNGNILHASGRVRIDMLAPEGILRPDGSLSHNLAAIRRIFG